MYGYVDVYEFPINKNNIGPRIIKSISNHNNPRTNGVCNIPVSNHSSCDPLLIEYTDNQHIKSINIPFLDTTGFFHKLIKNMILLPEYIFDASSSNNLANLYNTVIGYDIFTDKLSHFVDTIKFDISSSFMMKLHVDIKSKIIFFGDFHGSLHTLIRSLLRLKLDGLLDNNLKLQQNVFIVFLGDIIDRGIYGCELLYIIMDLKIINKNNVFICKGNHEMPYTSKRYGFYKELSQKYGDNYDGLYRNILDSWNYLPNAIFITYDNKKFIQLCHGGFCRSIDKIKDFLSSSQSVCQLTIDEADDFLWSDFACGEETSNGSIYGLDNIYRNIGRIYTSKEAIRYLKDVGCLMGIIRGHQDMLHNSKIIMDNKETCIQLNELHDDQPVDWKKIKNIHNDYFNVPANNIFSTTFPINTNLQNLKFPPIYTFSTAVSSRFINNDSYGILYYENTINDPESFKQKYIKYKQKYLASKNNK